MTTNAKSFFFRIFCFPAIFSAFLDSAPADETRESDLESHVLALLTDAPKEPYESRIRNAGYTSEEIWKLAKKARESQNITLLEGTNLALQITGINSEKVKGELTALFEIEKSGLNNLRTWPETFHNWESIFGTDKDRDDPKTQREVKFDIEFREWVILTAFLLGKDLDESEDVHPFLLPRLHVIMLTGLNWIKENGTEKSIPVLKTILANEGSNTGKGGIADYAKSALDAVVERIKDK